MPLPRANFETEQVVEVPAQPRHGGGGTNHKRPTGGGGDPFRDNPPGHRGPRERLTRYRAGIAVMLTTSMVLFMSLVIGFFFRKGEIRVDTHTGEFIRDWHPFVVPALLWVNTALMVLSSLTAEFARRAVFAEPAVMAEWLGFARATFKKTVGWLVLTMLLGSGFIAGQVVAWRELVAQGIYLSSNPASHYYYLLTGLHALHLVGGIIAMLVAAAMFALHRSLQSRQIAVDVTAWYWHAMGMVWIAIFILVKWGQ